MSSRLNGVLSPPSGSLSGASSPPRPRFPVDHLRPHMKTVIAKVMTGATWDPSDKPRMSSYSKEISDRVKARMVEIEPRGFKYIVTATLSENLGQAGRADMSCHWEDADVAVQEMFSNDSIILVCLAFAVRVI